MALVGQRYLMAIGGNDGKRPLADVWALDTTAKPYERRKLKPEGEGPPPCMYATVSACSDGLLLLCGGWDANSVNSQAQISSCMILKPWRHIIYYYHISKMWTKPLQEVYNAQEADDYFKCRLRMVRLRLIEVLGSFASTTIRIRI